MKLFEVPRHSRIKLKDGRELDFHHIDGMYSYCTDEGRPVHIGAWTDVEIISHCGQKPDLMSETANKTKGLTHERT